MALAMRSLASTKVAAAQTLRTGRVARVSVRVAARAGNWLPGSDAPSWIPEDQPGNFGFDPCGLAKEPSALERFTEAELLHCRWAMLGAAGVLAVEVLGFGTWYDAPLQALNGGQGTYFGRPMPLDLSALAGVEFVAFAVAETLRGQEADPEKRKYPGGTFDPMGMSKDAKNLPILKLKEIKNGRLAMVALLGFFLQHAATGKGPVAALLDHVNNPWGANCGTNGVSIPGF